MEELFRDFWWLIFPVFGMGMGLLGMFSTERRSREVLDVIKSYVDQGKDPPPELLRLAAESGAGKTGAASPSGSSWSFVVFAALAAGFTAGWYVVRAETWAFAFLIVAITMGVMAIGALVILLTSRT